MSRVSLAKACPALYKTMFELEKQLVAVFAPLDFSTGFAHLLRVRVSQINHCAFCCRMHAADALKAGESPDRLHTLVAWRETQYFSAKEQAALSLIEAVTQVAQDQVPDDVYDAAREDLSDEEVAAVAWLGVIINAWNRIAVTSRTPVGTKV